MSNLILASASPRRQQLLQQVGLPFHIIPADIDEQPHPGEAPQAYVLRMAHSKAQRIAQHYPMALVLGVDTIVTIDALILGKPRDAADARQMLRRLSGRSHTVLTGLALLRQSQGWTRLDSMGTQVHFRTLSDAEIDAYIATTEPLDKAGAYAIQGRARVFVDAFDGCYTNAVGLPVQRTAALLREAGLQIPSANE